MVWIYGGGFTGGSSSSPQTSGHMFAKQGVVLVAMNYRVGRFGFFAFPALSRERPNENKGNYAYMDQIAALQWVKQNIAAFGGNPNNVTIFGFSAGGVSVHSMLVSPQARGLFDKAIVESGGSRDSVLTARPLRDDGIDPNYPVSAETIGTTFAKSMGIDGTDAAALEKLRGLSAEQVLRGAPHADSRWQTDYRDCGNGIQSGTCAAHPLDAWQQQRRHRWQSRALAHEGRILRTIWPVECRSEGRLRPRRHDRPRHHGVPRERRLWSGGACTVCCQRIRGERVACLPLPVLVRPDVHA
jgi:carboxylesterase type B